MQVDARINRMETDQNDVLMRAAAVWLGGQQQNNESILPGRF